jgi:ABC-type phosphate transport system substrate-binding protein
MFTNGWPTGTVSDFINFVVCKEGQDLVKKVGYVPLF